MARIVFRLLILFGQRLVLFSAIAPVALAQSFQPPPGLLEQSRFEALAARTPWEAPLPRKRHPLGVQFLGLQRLELKNAQSPAEVLIWQYHYALARGRLLRVDSVQNRIIDQQWLNDPHLPLNDAEIDAAKQILMAREDMLNVLRDEQRRRGQSAFVRLDELDLKVSILRPNEPEHPCATERCALLTLVDTQRTVFSAIAWVNLQRMNAGWVAR